MSPSTWHLMVLIVYAVLVIPFRLIWTFKVQWSQKLVLTSTLCLTTITIICTITRVAGVRTSSRDQSLDTAWQTYWQFITADIAIAMTAATAFRAFFVSRQHDRVARGESATPFWLGKSWRYLKFKLGHLSWRTKSSEAQFADDTSDQRMVLPRIKERATMTGIRTFINHLGVDPEC